MKATVFLTFAAAVLAQDLSGQPACATSCLSSAISAAGCAATDEACQCGPTQSIIIASAVPCLLAACTNPADLNQAQSAGSSRCSAFSATATGATATSTTSGLSTTSGGGATLTGGSNSTLSMVMTVPPSTTSKTTSTSASTTKASTTRSTQSQSPQSTNAAAAQVGLGVGGVLAFLGAVIAL